MDRFITVLAVLGILFKGCVSMSHASQLNDFDEEGAPVLCAGIDRISFRLKQLEGHLDEYLSPPPKNSAPKERGVEKENTPAFDFSQTSSVKSFPKAKIRPHSVMESKDSHEKKKVTKNNSNPSGKKRTQFLDTKRKKGKRFSKNASFDFDLDALTIEQKKRFLSIEKILSEIPAKERKYSVELYKVVAYGIMLRLSPQEISKRYGFSRGNISHIRIGLEENGLINESEG